MKLNIKIKDRLTKIIACIVSAGILFMLYHRLDIQSLRIILERLNYSYLWAILFFSLIIQFLAALRWSLMIRTLCNRLSFYDCFKLTSSSGALNAILPSKLGHFAKVYFMAEKNLIDLRVGISMVFYEKLSDLAVMSFIFLIAAGVLGKMNIFILSTIFAAIVLISIHIVLHVLNISNLKFVDHIRKVKFMDKIVYFFETIFLFHQSGEIEKSRLALINLVTLILWIVYVFQTMLFFYMLALKVPFFMIVTYMLGAMFVGILPISIAGIGTRDLAIVYLFHGIIEYSEAVFIGMLCTLRYVLSALIGLPFLLRIIFAIDHKQNRTNLHPAENSILD
ncbi:MAG: lysylphosphatidylglycerol synthase transmembrane domain-containing protein [Desulfobacterales bacterium]|nr:lysylphosphatidylglycerol synthase transmembrane domain-containing protein [Desulfobacterales bacterium]MDP6806669.1 lysylphosphatidylglycerol synthase transmembrane domain-containing protein [Desulfobacterales bacterium]|tara:strand:+ start:38120 stop:39127 length:1008 start_codon:yes stop_codon:yes gene_type:complete